MSHRKASLSLALILLWSCGDSSSLTDPVAIDLTGSRQFSESMSNSLLPVDCGSRGTTVTRHSDDGFTGTHLADGVFTSCGGFL